MPRPPASILRLSRLATRVSQMQQPGEEPPLDKTPHGTEGRLQRSAAPGAASVGKTEGPRAYAPRI